MSTPERASILKKWLHELTGVHRRKAADSLLASLSFILWVSEHIPLTRLPPIVGRLRGTEGLAGMVGSHCITYGVYDKLIRPQNREERECFELIFDVLSADTPSTLKDMNEHSSGHPNEPPGQRHVDLFQALSTICLFTNAPLEEKVGFLVDLFDFAHTGRSGFGNRPVMAEREGVITQDAFIMLVKSVCHGLHAMKLVPAVTKQTVADMASSAFEPAHPLCASATPFNHEDDSLSTHQYHFPPVVRPGDGLLNVSGFMAWAATSTHFQLLMSIIALAHKCRTAINTMHFLARRAEKELPELQTRVEDIRQRKRLKSQTLGSPEQPPHLVLGPYIVNLTYFSVTFLLQSSGECEIVCSVRHRDSPAVVETLGQQCQSNELVAFSIRELTAESALCAHFFLRSGVDESLVPISVVDFETSPVWGHEHGDVPGIVLWNGTPPTTHDRVEQVSFTPQLQEPVVCLSSAKSMHIPIREVLKTYRHISNALHATGDSEKGEHILAQPGGLTDLLWGSMRDTLVRSLMDDYTPSGIQTSPKDMDLHSLLLAEFCTYLKPISISFSPFLPFEIDDVAHVHSEQDQAGWDSLSNLIQGISENFWLALRGGDKQTRSSFPRLEDLVCSVGHFVLIPAADWHATLGGGRLGGARQSKGSRSHNLSVWSHRDAFTKELQSFLEGRLEEVFSSRDTTHQHTVIIVTPKPFVDSPLHEIVSQESAASGPTSGGQSHQYPLHNNRLDESEECKVPVRSGKGGFSVGHTRTESPDIDSASPSETMSHLPEQALEDLLKVLLQWKGGDVKREVLVLSGAHWSVESIIRDSSGNEFKQYTLGKYCENSAKTIKTSIGGSITARHRPIQMKHSSSNRLQDRVTACHIVASHNKLAINPLSNEGLTEHLKKKKPQDTKNGYDLSTAKVLLGPIVGRVTHQSACILVELDRATTLRCSLINCCTGERVDRAIHTNSGTMTRIEFDELRADTPHYFTMHGVSVDVKELSHAFVHTPPRHPTGIRCNTIVLDMASITGCLRNTLPLLHHDAISARPRSDMNIVMVQNVCSPSLLKQVQAILHRYTSTPSPIYHTTLEEAKQMLREAFRAAVSHPMIRKLMATTPSLIVPGSHALNNALMLEYGSPVGKTLRQLFGTVVSEFQSQAWGHSEVGGGGTGWKVERGYHLGPALYSRFSQHGETGVITLSLSLIEPTRGQQTQSSLDCAPRRVYSLGAAQLTSLVHLVNTSLEGGSGPITSLRQHHIDTGEQERTPIRVLIVVSELPLLDPLNEYIIDDEEMHALLTLLFEWKKRKSDLRRFVFVSSSELRDSATRVFDTRTGQWEQQLVYKSVNSPGTTDESKPITQDTMQNENFIWIHQNRLYGDMEKCALSHSILKVVNCSVSTPSITSADYPRPGGGWKNGDMVRGDQSISLLFGPLVGEVTTSAVRIVAEALTHMPGSVLTCTVRSTRTNKESHQSLPVVSNMPLGFFFEDLSPDTSYHVFLHPVDSNSPPHQACFHTLAQNPTTMRLCFIAGSDPVGQLLHENSTTLPIQAYLEKALRTENWHRADLFRDSLNIVREELLHSQSAWSTMATKQSMVDRRYDACIHVGGFLHPHTMKRSRSGDDANTRCQPPQRKASKRGRHSIGKFNTNGVEGSMKAILGKASREVTQRLRDGYRGMWSLVGYTDVLRSSGNIMLQHPDETVGVMTAAVGDLRNVPSVKDQSGIISKEYMSKLCRPVNHLRSPDTEIADRDAQFRQWNGMGLLSLYFEPDGDGQSWVASESTRRDLAEVLAIPELVCLVLCTHIPVVTQRFSASNDTELLDDIPYSTINEEVQQWLLDSVFTWVGRTRTARGEFKRSACFVSGSFQVGCITHIVDSQSGAGVLQYTLGRLASDEKRASLITSGKVLQRYIFRITLPLEEDEMVSHSWPVLDLKLFAEPRQGILQGNIRPVKLSETPLHVVIGPILGPLCEGAVIEEGQSELQLYRCNILVEMSGDCELACILSDVLSHETVRYVLDVRRGRPQTFRLSGLGEERRFRVTFEAKGARATTFARLDTSTTITTPRASIPRFNALIVSGEVMGDLKPKDKNIWSQLSSLGRGYNDPIDLVIHLGMHSTLEAVAIDTIDWLRSEIVRNKGQRSQGLFGMEEDEEWMDERVRERFREAYRRTFSLPSINQSLTGSYHLLLSGERDVFDGFASLDSFCERLRSGHRNEMPGTTEPLLDTWSEYTSDEVNELYMDVVDRVRKLALEVTKEYHTQLFTFQDEEEQQSSAPHQGCFHSWRRGRVGLFYFDIHDLGVQQNPLTKGGQMEPNAVNISEAQWEEFERVLSHPALQALVVCSEVPFIWESTTGSKKAGAMNSQMLEPKKDGEKYFPGKYSQRDWAFNPGGVSAVVSRLIQWRSEVSGREVYLVGGYGRGFKGCATTSIELNRNGEFPEALNQMVAGPITAQTLGCAVPDIKGKFADLQFTHSQARVERCVGVVSVLVGKDESGPVSTIEGHILNYKESAKRYQPTLALPIPQWLSSRVPCDDVVFFEDEVILQARESSACVDMRVHVDSESFESAVEEAYRHHHLDDLMRPTHLRFMDLSSPEAFRYCLYGALRDVWFTLPESIRLGASDCDDEFVLDLLLKYTWKDEHAFYALDSAIEVFRELFYAAALLRLATEISVITEEDEEEPESSDNEEEQLKGGDLASEGDGGVDSFPVEASSPETDKDESGADRDKSMSGEESKQDLEGQVKLSAEEERVAKMVEDKRMENAFDAISDGREYVEEEDNPMKDLLEQLKDENPEMYDRMMKDPLTQLAIEHPAIYKARSALLDRREELEKVCEEFESKRQIIKEVNFRSKR